MDKARTKTRDIHGKEGFKSEKTNENKTKTKKTELTSAVYTQVTTEADIINNLAPIENTSRTTSNDYDRAIEQ